MVNGYRLSANLIWKGKESKLENFLTYIFNTV